MDIMLVFIQLSDDETVNIFKDLSRYSRWKKWQHIFKICFLRQYI